MAFDEIKGREVKGVQSKYSNEAIDPWQSGLAAMTVAGTQPHAAPARVADETSRAGTFFARRVPGATKVNQVVTRSRCPKCTSTHSPGRVAER
jgi:hypothetical protein